ncbi:MAG: ATP synthase F1 subunit epsilon [Puniceicoccales bacterium]|jgi:F-type H+-transporting ATPase subunit epsilon|nr:ATP synthase F1 subunit epsilon [Puniceicoccales bacterium]
MMPIFLEIVTPAREVFSGEASSVIIPTALGEIEILPEHRPIIALVWPGNVLVSTIVNLENIAVSSGFLNLRNNRLSILVDEAVDIKFVDIDSVKDAKEAAEKALEIMRSKSNYDQEEIEKIEAKIRYHIAQLVGKANIR